MCSFALQLLSVMGKEGGREEGSLVPMQAPEKGLVSTVLYMHRHPTFCV